MHQDSKIHTLHYFLLLAIFVLATLSFFIFQFERLMQVYVVIVTAFAYFLWGIIHHYLEDNLYLKVVVEYFLIALLGSLVLIFLIYRT